MQSYGRACAGSQMAQMFCHICNTLSICKNPTFYKLNIKVMLVIQEVK